MSKSKPQEHQVTLMRDHTHAGRDYPAGSTITVTAPVRDWLRANRVIGDAATTENQGAQQ